MNDFAVFILSNNRANNVITYRTLREADYLGKIYIVIDDLDDQIEDYKSLYGDDVIVFDKKLAAKSTDTVDNFEKLNIVVYARNVINDIAINLCLKYYLVLDDDYESFNYRFTENDLLKYKKIYNLTDNFNAMIDFLNKTEALTVAYAQGGDYIGGTESSLFKKGLLRKAMNAFFCKTNREIEYIGSINEDVNMYVLANLRGELVMTPRFIQLEQKRTQSNNGGLTDIYLDMGTYVKSFYSVIVAPSCVTVRTMGPSNTRLHHSVNWDSAAVKIIDEKYKKEFYEKNA